MSKQLVTFTEGTVKWSIKFCKEKYINIYQRKCFPIHQAPETFLILSASKGLYTCTHIKAYVPR